MTKKSAAQFKPVPKQPEVEVMTDEQMQEYFDNSKEMFVLTVKTNIETAKRIDYLMWVRDQAYKFWGNLFDEQFIAGERLEYYRHLQEVCIEAYTKVAEIAETFELEEFKKEDMKDYFSGIVPAVDEIKTEASMFEAELMFLAVQPYGSKMNQLHQLIIGEVEKQIANAQ